MSTVVGTMALLALAVSLWCHVAVNLGATEFFANLTRQHPESAAAFPKPMVGTTYGPIRPSYVNFQKAKHHLELTDPGLRTQGADLLQLLYV